MPLPPDYEERVYAGVLGKLIGVYLGRPFESWTYERIAAELGEIRGYVQTRPGVPLVVTDDDITGTFTFPRSLPDHGNDPDLTPQQIGETWLNYTVEGRTIFWWGGLGNSTEHTAYLRLKRGTPAPESGSITLNGKTIAEQIGSQIFIDGWAMLAPGDPERAADLARRAASVSHDGEAVYGAQVIAAMEALAFVEPDINRLLDAATGLIPSDSTIRRLIDDVREWHAGEPDWRTARARIAANYGYDKYRGPCHMVPNHALIVLALLYGNDDFAESLMIVNTSGWDTDCNSGNVGCLLGIKNGLAGIDASPVDWRGPIADRLYLATADGGRAITDAVAETYHLVNTARALAGQAPLAPKDGARFHFDFPGAVQGFQVDPADGDPALTIENVAGHSVRGTRSLALRYHGLETDRTARVTTATFIPPEAMAIPGYGLLASPTLYPGQTVRAELAADPDDAEPVTARLFLRCYDTDDRLETVDGPEASLAPGARQEVAWRVPDTGGRPIAQVGIALTGAAAGTVYLDVLTWDGAPDVVLTRPPDVPFKPTVGATMWRRAWVDAVDLFRDRWPESFRLVQNAGTGVVSQGTSDWVDYRVTADVTPYMMKSGGLGARVQGLRRYYALVLAEGGTARLVKALDGVETLAETDFPWSFFQSYDLALEVVGNRLRAWIDDRLLFDIEDDEPRLDAGGVALICEEGCLGCDAVRIAPAG